MTVDLIATGRALPECPGEEIPDGLISIMPGG